jgi:hypothetical protein
VNRKLQGAHAGVGPGRHAVALIVVLFATGLLRNLPQPVLAAIVLAR